ncbi:hypothetical protein GN244_ATG02325 [Phytophthora infestans]|uniref:Uncharacterized protein n=1 Tax=Phytophthora infestans TaxID=4787 RepID=A0A833TRE8_PHYIN|nr:hypothetical protein GN244_ATG02325 [Phytophthora infestans]
MYEYKFDGGGSVYRVSNDEWRDLDGGDVLPGFHVEKSDLKMVLNSDADVSPDEDEIEIICPCRGCGERLLSLPKCSSHLEQH